MNAIAVFVAIGLAATPGGPSGRVVDAQDRPIAGARVFAEPGLGGALVETTSDAQGAWRFDALPAASPLGIFAIAEGFAFGGVTFSSTEEAQDVKIRLSTSASLSGRVVNAKKDPVKAVRITRVGLLGVQKVGIPLAKLKSFGFDEPATDADGRFTISRMPEGGQVAIKVAHPEYAQEAVDDLAVGAAGVSVTLHPGVLFEGGVLLREGKIAVAAADVIVRNAQPPHDTAVTRTNGSGHFALRLKPGVYLYQASAQTSRSPGWQQLTLTGEEPRARAIVYLAGTGRILGKVCDAVSGGPVAGAKIAVDVQGNVAAVVRTGPTGEFLIVGAEGENIVRLDSAPGYCPPEQPSLRVQVVAGKELTLPTFWLAPLPTYTIEVVGADMNPAPGVIITILRPLQFGWHVADERGRATLRFNSLPPDGIVVGMVEHAEQPLGAVFAAKQQEANPARVQLFPLGGVRGRVVTEKGKPVEGCVVAGLLGDNAWPLWRTVSNSEGGFEWKSVVPSLPQRAVAGADQEGAAEGASFVVDPSGSKDMGDIPGTEGLIRTSLLGKPLPWHENRLLSGTLPDRKARKTLPMVVVYCSLVDAPIAVESFSVAHRIFSPKGIGFALVVDGVPTEPLAATFPILSGPSPGPATTYLVGPQGVVVLETFGMPPLRALQELTR
jgi:hypothetical protein